MKNAQAFTLLLSIYHKFKNIAIGKKRIFSGLFAGAFGAV